MEQQKGETLPEEHEQERAQDPEQQEQETIEKEQQQQEMMTVPEQQHELTTEGLLPKEQEGAEQQQEETLSVKGLLKEVDGMLRALSDQVEESYARGISKDGDFLARCEEPLHKCGFDPETQTPDEASFAPAGLEQNPVFNQEVSFEANTVYLTRTADRSGPAVRSLKCTAALLKNTYVRNWRKHGSVKTRYVQQYFADQNTGSLVQHPARAWLPEGPDGGQRFQDRCASPEGDYDVRAKSWYSQHVTGPKDIVLVLDTSGSMKENSRGILALQAARRVLGQLSVSDLATVVTFSDAARAPPGGPVLRQMTRAHREELLKWLDGTNFDGGTNFEAGLRMAFEALRGADGTERSHPIEDHVGFPIRSTENCEKLVLFLTDGHATEGEKSVEGLARLLEEWNKGLGARLLTYSFGAGAAKRESRDLACSAGGVWWHVEEGADLADAMTSYYKVLAVSKSEKPEDRPVRFQYYPYDLAGGFDLGACAAVFDRTTTPNMLFGLSCMSANMLADINRIRNATDFDAALLEAGQKSLTCSTPELNAEDMQLLRQRISGPLAVCGDPRLEFSGAMMKFQSPSNLLMILLILRGAVVSWSW